MGKLWQLSFDGMHTYIHTYITAAPLRLLCRWPMRCVSSHAGAASGVAGDGPGYRNRAPPPPSTPSIPYLSPRACAACVACCCREMHEIMLSSWAYQEKETTYIISPLRRDGPIGRRWSTSGGEGLRTYTSRQSFDVIAVYS